MIENEVIVQLEEMVERLISVQEDKLNGECEKRRMQVFSKENSLDKLQRLEPFFNNLSKAKEARKLLRSAKAHHLSTSGTDTDTLLKYLDAAKIVYEAVRGLSASDTERVFCGVEIPPSLNYALLKAMCYPDLYVGAYRVYNFINTEAPARSWTYDDYHHRGSKNFELVTSETDFARLLSNGYSEITGSHICGIRIAYKKECVCIILSDERATKEEQLKKAIGHIVYKSTYKNCMGILYPESSFFNSTYQIYVPIK